MLLRRTSIQRHEGRPRDLAHRQDVGTRHVMSVTLVLRRRRHQSFNGGGSFNAPSPGMQPFLVLELVVSAYPVLTPNF